MRLIQLALALATGVTLFGGSAAQFCIENIQDIYTAEAEVIDTSVRRLYILCPRRIFDVGFLDLNFDLQGFNPQPPLPIRPNMTIRCGDTGERSNLCWMNEGDLHVDATPFRGISDDTIEGVRLEGIVFIAARKYSTWATKPGDITFKDCEWRDHTKAVVPIMLDWFDGSDTTLDVTFDGCTIQDNRYFGLGSYTSMIYANGKQNALTIVDTVFENNDMLNNNTQAATSSSIIETLGPLKMTRSCFLNNQVGVSTVTVFGGGFSSADNFEADGGGDLCPFASVFLTLQQFDDFDPICVAPGRNSCVAGGTASPTVEPSASPTDVPSSSPTAEPSGTPTGAPSPSPSDTPSKSPSPTAADATLEPTAQPVEFAFPTNPPAPTSGSSGSTSRVASCILSVILVAVGVFIL